MGNLSELEIWNKSPSEIDNTLKFLDQSRIKQEAIRRMEMYGHHINTDIDYGDKFDFLVTFSNSHLTHKMCSPSNNSNNVGSGIIQKLGYKLEDEGKDISDSDGWDRYYKFDPYYL